MTSKAQTIILAIVTILVLPIKIGLAQSIGVDRDSFNQRNSLSQPNEHDGRITRSFTEPIEQSTIATAVPGVIQQIVITEGQRVKKGDQLAVINHGVLLAEKKIAIARSNFVAEVAAARANLKIKRERKENVESLLSTGHVNQYELDELKSECEQAQAEFHAAENSQKINLLQIEKIQAEINDRFIQSPISGFVTEIHKQIGEHVSASDPEFATVVRVDQLKVRFYLDELALSELQVGTQVNVLLGVNRTPRTAEVIFVSPTIDPDSGTGRVHVKVDNEDLKIRSGTVCHWLSVVPNTETAKSETNQLRNKSLR